ncbi:hypothetical protein G9A89_023389 [Geosiphon pyriformis]|nr:hypothetical protein G9A89_023389 [Geosiphon pyriformis]
MQTQSSEMKPSSPKIFVENEFPETSIETPNSKTAYLPSYCLFVAFVSVLTAFENGWNIGVTNVPEKTIRNCEHGGQNFLTSTLPDCLPMENLLWGFAVGSYAFGGLLGSLMGGNLQNRFGRVPTLRVNNLNYILGGIVLASAINPAMFIIGRIFTGIGSGISTVTVPTYLGEIATTKGRGALGTSHHLFIVIGVLVSQIFGLWLSFVPGWRFLLALNALPALIQIILLKFCVETPRYLILKNRLEEANNSLQQLRKGYDIQTEFKEIVEARNNFESQNPELLSSDGLSTNESIIYSGRSLSLHELFQDENCRKMIFICFGVHTMQQICGINGIIYYSTEIFSTVFGNSASYATIAVGLVNLVFTTFAVMIVDKNGRRPLLLLSQIGVFISSVLVIFGSFYAYDVLVVISVLLFVASFAIGLGPIPFLLIPELIPTHGISAAASVISSLNWILNFSSTATFPVLNSTLGNYTFLAFAVISAIGALATYIFLPETKGRTLEVMHREVGGRTTSYLYCYKASKKRSEKTFWTTIALALRPSSKNSKFWQSMSADKTQLDQEPLDQYQDELPLSELVYAFDWSSTELGAMNTWPTSLKTVVDLCLHSVFPMVLYCGSDKVLIYNQMWRPILKLKHPEALGKPAKEVWPEIWDVIGPIFDKVMLTGKGQFNDDLLLLMSRAGYTEECYFSFTFSPIFGENGDILGLFTPVQETTQRVLSARRLKTLSELGNRTPGAKSIESSCHLVTTALREHNADITYAIIYLIEHTHINENDKGYIARLTATTFDDNLLVQSADDGVDELQFVEGKSTRNLPDFLPKTCGHLDVTKEMEAFLENRSKPRDSNQKSTDQSNPISWPLKEVIRNNKYVTVSLAEGSQAILLPVLASFSGKSMLTAVLICGINKHRALDAPYLEFCQLVIGHVSSSLTNGRSREEERKQAELLADLNRQKIMFFQNISHELRTPLTLMLAPLEDTIATCGRESPFLGNLEMIQRNTRRLLKLVNTLLQFSRIEAGHLEARYNESNIAKITKELASNFESMAKSFGLTYKIDIPDCEVLESQLERKVYLDLDFYEKIVFNLCSNAFKYTWYGGVTVRLYADRKECGEVVVLEVSDTGVGIEKEHLGNLFQRFYRIESKQSRSHEGTGIGLALVKELAKHHGGDITVTSEAGVGSTFQVYLLTGKDHLSPSKIVSNDLKEDEKSLASSSRGRIANNVDLYLEESDQWITRKPDSYNFITNFEEKKEEEEDANKTMEHLKSLSIASPTLEAYKETSTSVLSTEESTNPNRRYTVLVVEDNNDMRNYLANILKLEFEVFCAYDGHQALTLINNRELKPDLVLSDIMMPNINGLELTKLLRSDPSTQRIPIILLSARAGEEASVEGLERGADDYLIKPFNGRELIARVRVNIKLSNLRYELVVQQHRQIQTKQLLFSISSKIRSGLSIEEILSTAVDEINRILTCDSIFILFSDPMNKGSAKIMAAPTSCSKTQPLVGTHVIGRGIDESQERWVDHLDGLPDLDAFSYDRSSFLGSFTRALADQPVPIQNKLVPRLYNADTDNDFLDLEIETHANYFSPILNESVSSVSVAIHLNSSFWGWIIAHRKPNENWSDSEKMFLQQISNQISLAITHAKLSEEKLKREAQMEAAKAANEAKSQILANTSHELRTPLGAIIGVLSALEDTPLSTDQKDMVQIMTRASDVVLSVVNDILDAAKLEAQKITLACRTFDLFDLVEKTIEIFGERAGTKQIELVLIFDPTELPKYVKSDPERLQQILMNLLSNSLKFTDSGEIVLKISSIDVQNTETELYSEPNTHKTGSLLIELTDTGIGIDPVFIKDIWDSFSQGDPSMTRRQDGTGLGLSICKHLVSINGGDLGVQSELNKGSRFWFTWNIEPLTLKATPLKSLHQLANGEPMFVLPSKIKLRRVMVIDTVAVSRSAMVAMLNPNVDKVEAFEDCSKAVMASKAWRDQYHSPPWDLVFFNVSSKNTEQVLKAAKELQSICEDKLAIGLLVFWSAGGRALGKELIRKIGGHTAALCKPVMRQRLLDCLCDKEIFNSAKMDEPKPTVGLSINRFRVEDYDYHNRPTLSTDQESTIIRSSDVSIEPDIEMIQEALPVSAINISPEEELTAKLQKPNSSRLPSKRSASSDINGSSQSESSKKSRTRAVSQSKCILCVEDNPINMKVILHQLTKLGYQSLSATNGQEAIDIVQGEIGDSIDSDVSTPKTRISLILMDCAMPVMSGFDASRAIRGMKPPQSEIPIIALTASAAKGTRDKCLESGMSDYLTKPLKLLQLKSKLIQWLGES